MGLRTVPPGCIDLAYRRMCQDHPEIVSTDVDFGDALARRWSVQQLTVRYKF